MTNGYAVRTSDGDRLGGAGPILVKWSGVLLVEREGEYRFHAGAPTPEGEKPDFELAEKSQWRVTLQRGAKTFAVLNHEWPGNTEPEVHEPRLRRGAYQITIEYSQPAPDLSTSHPHRKRTGFQVKYAGPDSEDCLVTLPVHRLYRDYQNQTLDQGITFLPGSKNAQAFLKAFYTSTLRDMRRTYQRAFKAVLFSGKLDLSARRREDHQSELGYMLANPVNFAGYAYYRTSPSAFTQHLRQLRLQFPADRGQLSSADRGRPHGAVASAIAGDVRLVGTPLRLHRRAQAVASAVQGSDLAALRGSEAQSSGRSRASAPPYRRGAQVLGSRSALLPGPSRARSIPSRTPISRTTAGWCACGTPTTGSAA